MADSVKLSLEDETDGRARNILEDMAKGGRLKGPDRSFLARLYAKRRNPDTYGADTNKQRNVRRHIHDARGGHSGKFIWLSIA